MSKPLFTVRVDVVHWVAPKAKAQPSRRRRQPGAPTRLTTLPKGVGEIITELFGRYHLKVRVK